MVDGDVCFTTIGDKDLCEASSLSRPGELPFMISSSRAVIFGYLWTIYN